MAFSIICGSVNLTILYAKIPSFKITDLAKALKPDCELDEVGVREGEKLHEIMITTEDSPYTIEYEKYFIIYPHMEWYDIEKNKIAGGKRVPDGFEYTSGNNREWMSVSELAAQLPNVLSKII